MRLSRPPLGVGWEIGPSAMQGTSMIDGGQLFVRREDGSSLVIGVTAPESLTVAGLLHLVEVRTRAACTRAHHGAAWVG